MRNKFLGTGEPGYHPLRKLRVVLSGLRYAALYDFSVAYKLVLSAVVLAAAAAHLLGWARGRAIYYCATWRVLLRHRAHVLPNPSLEARPNIKTPGPRGGRAHFPPHGPGVLLLVPPQLER